MAIYLGVDGGGSGCRARAVDGAGASTPIFEAGPANVHTDPETALANIMEVVAAALRGHDLSDVKAVLGVAGASVESSAEGLRQRLPFPGALVVSDAVTAIRGAHGRADGLISAIGTGSVHASQRDGAVRRIGGHGFLLGDEGSGAWMGRRLLARALQAHDGLVPDSDLLRAVRAEFGGPAPMIAAARSAHPGEFARHAPRIIAADAAGDSAGVEILTAATEEIARAISVLQGDDPLPVAFAGGLGEVFAGRLRDRWTVVKAQGSALDGAIGLARELG